MFCLRILCLQAGYKDFSPFSCQHSLPKSQQNSGQLWQNVSWALQEINGIFFLTLLFESCKNITDVRMSE